MGRMDVIQMKIDTLLDYRDVLEGSERELFDMLMCYANEVALAMEKRDIRGC